MAKRQETRLVVLEETVKPSETGRIVELEKTVEELQKRMEEMKKQMESVNVLDRIKVKMPRFQGPNAEDWIFRADNFFSLAKFSDKQKLDASPLLFDGEAFTWFRFSQRINPFKSWGDLKERMLLRFGLSRDELYEQLLNLRQEGSVVEYRREFERVVSKLQDVPEMVLEAGFLNGLKSEIKRNVKIFTREPGLDAYIDCALRVEMFCGDAIVPMNDAGEEEIE